ncbi:unnamed protein product [Notodromas monacha]|uniref:RING-type domain-containing protein n=1 Tax=Notodromas monacha TaxID=399045 RepID=A0A7R9G9H4_9CRUS|nr:unnamed protein product [Notodromas monacha]CAG0914271.1 unnamed protein product [Notodromas monacha]
MSSMTIMKVRDLHPQIICPLCGGYFIDATTIVECLHSFCRSCIVRYLETSKYCPICDVQIHKTKPLLNIRPDKTLQDIVFKLVPGLFEDEMRRRREFYSKHPESEPADLEENGRMIGHRYVICSSKDMINVALSPRHSSAIVGSKSRLIDQLKCVGPKRFFYCPAMVTIGHLKHLLRNKLGPELLKHGRLEIFWQDAQLPDPYTLLDIGCTYPWNRSKPMHLSYRIVAVRKDEENFRLMNGEAKKLRKKRSLSRRKIRLTSEVLCSSPVRSASPALPICDNPAESVPVNHLKSSDDDTKENVEGTTSLEPPESVPSCDSLSESEPLKAKRRKSEEPEFRVPKLENNLPLSSFSPLMEVARTPEPPPSEKVEVRMRKRCLTPALINGVGEQEELRSSEVRTPDVYPWSSPLAGSWAQYYQHFHAGLGSPVAPSPPLRLNSSFSSPAYNYPSSPIPPLTPPFPTPRAMIPPPMLSPTMNALAHSSMASSMMWSQAMNYRQFHHHQSLFGQRQWDIFDVGSVFKSAFTNGAHSSGASPPMFPHLRSDASSFYSPGNYVSPNPQRELPKH